MVPAVRAVGKPGPLGRCVNEGNRTSIRGFEKLSGEVTFGRGLKDEGVNAVILALSSPGLAWACVDTEEAGEVPPREVGLSLVLGEPRAAGGLALRSLQETRKDAMQHG